MGGKGKAAEEKRGLESASAKLSFLLEKEKELQKISGSGSGSGTGGRSSGKRK